MSKLRLLIVEDNDRDLRSFRNSVRKYTHETQREIDLVECKDREGALAELDKSFDGAIIDLTLLDQNEAGNQIVEKIIESFFRIPIAIFTGNEHYWDENLNAKILLIGIFRKGRIEHEKILDRFWDIYNTGLTHIMGGRGKIETTLNQVFLENLKPNRKRWISYAEGEEENSERTQKALLRYTLNHLLQLLEDDREDYFPEEVYLYPPVLDEVTTRSKLTTGSIVKENNQWFVVLSPACDLITGRGGQFTERILFVEIEKEADIVNKALNRLQRITDEEEKQKVKEDILQRLSRNNHCFYYHWLPPVNFKFSGGGSLDFDGGFLNFRKSEALSKRKFRTKFRDPLIQISPFFVKDIVSRFSSYYARQGQPDIDSEEFIARYTT